MKRILCLLILALSAASVFGQDARQRVTITEYRDSATVPPYCQTGRTCLYMDAGTLKQVRNGVVTAVGGSSGTGDLVGPSSATDNAVVRFDLATGKLVQNSVVLIGDTGNVTGLGTLNTHTIPGGTDTFALLAAAQALSGKTYNGLTINTTTGTLAVTNGKTLTASNSVTFTGTDGSSVAFGAGGTIAYTNVAALSSLTTHGTITSGGLGTGAVIGGVTMTLGSDGSGDVYYRNGSGVLTRVAAGAQNTVFTMGASSVPGWAASGSTTYATSGNYWPFPQENFGTAANSSALVGSANQVRAVKVFLNRAITVDRLGIKGAAGSAGLASFAIYNADGSSRTVYSGTIDSNTGWTAAQAVTVSASGTVGPGYVMVAWTADNTSATIYTHAYNSNWLQLQTVGTTAVVGTCANAATSGALPSTCGTFTADSSITNFPMLNWFKN